MFWYDKGIRTNLSINRYIETTIIFHPTMDILLSSYLITVDGDERRPTTKRCQAIEEKNIGDTKNIE